jgi:hypothetical protein
LNDQETSLRYALGLQYVGEESEYIEDQESRLPQHAWIQVREVVIRMHELGLFTGTWIPEIWHTIRATAVSFCMI